MVFRDFIHKVDHSQINIVRPKAFQQVCKCSFGLLKVPGPHILAVLPGGTQVPLDDPALPAAFDGGPDMRADIRLRHPAVQDIDPLFLTIGNNLPHLYCGMAFQPFRPQSDFTDLKSCSA